MRTLSNTEMAQVNGAGFWDGFVCGVAIGAALSEGGLNPLVDLAAVGACGQALANS